MEINCPNQSFNPNGTLRCAILAAEGLTHYAGAGNPHFPCDRCRAGWTDGQPTLENPGTVVLVILEAHRARVAALDPAAVDPPAVAAPPAAPDGQAKGCGGCGGLSQEVKDLMSGKKKPRGLNR